MQTGADKKKEPKGSKTAEKRTRRCYQNSLSYNNFGEASKPSGAESGAISDLPTDLQQVIDHWHALPPEIKQTILTLVKHAR